MKTDLWCYALDVTPLTGDPVEMPARPRQPARLHLPRRILHHGLVTELETICGESIRSFATIFDDAPGFEQCGNCVNAS